MSLKLTQIFSSQHAKFITKVPNASTPFPDLNGIPEVIVAGRANSGKSSLFNAVFGTKDLIKTSKTAGRTRSIDFFRAGPEPGELVLVDAPGYGARGRPEWGTVFDKYVEERQELRRIYVTFNAKHGLNKFDVAMLQHLSDKCASGLQRWSIQGIVTKADTLPIPALQETIEKIKYDIRTTLCLPPLITSVKMHGGPFGIDSVQMNILHASRIVL